MSHYFNTDPAVISLYRQSTGRGVSSAGIQMTRLCSVCNQKVNHTLAKKVKGTGSSRHNPTVYKCLECMK